MADYSEWLSGGGEYGGFGEDALDPEEQQSFYAQRQERDVVLCLVDCREDMFTPFQAEKEVVAEEEVEKEKSKRGAKAKQESKSPSGGVVKVEETMTSTDRASTAGDTVKKNKSKSPFEIAMEFILQFFQNKVITSDRDMVALAFYDTEKSRNVYDIQGLYVVNSFHILGVESVQEVELLLAAGNNNKNNKNEGSSASLYEDFKQKVGHRDPAKPTSLDEALWAAQHMFVNLKNKAIKYKRIFLFTNKDNPCEGDSLGLTRCTLRARDLVDSGVTLEVFGIGLGAPEGAAMTVSSSGGGTAGTGGTVFASASAPAPTTTASGNPSTSVGSETLSSTVVFQKEKFWAPLIEGGVSVEEDTTVEYRGGVYVGGKMEKGASEGINFDALNDAFKLKVHPQRPSHHCKLMVGLRTDGGEVPTIGVSVFHPLMKAMKPKSEVLEGRSNCLLKRKTRLVVKPSATEGEERPADDEEEDDESKKGKREEVAVQDLQYMMQVGGRRLYLTPKEKESIIQTASAGAPVGLSILCFKREESVLLHDHMIQRSSFLHFNWSANEPHRSSSIKFFVQLVRSLYVKGKVAIAQYRWRHTSQPRLVALVPSIDDDFTAGRVNYNAGYIKRRRLPFPPMPSRPVEGMGLYMVPLPYAEDLREVPQLAQTTLAVKHQPPLWDQGEDPLLEEELDLAKDIIQKLSVEYSLSTVPNPSLQRLYHTLQRLALRRTNHQEREASFLLEGGAEGQQRDDCVDYSLPDVEGLRRYADLYQKFNATVLRADHDGYDPDRLCPQPKSATATTRAREGETTEREAGERKKVKRDLSASDIVELVDSFHQRNALASLTVAQLREYCQLQKVNLKGATKKDAIVEAVKRHLQTVKKEE